MNVNDMSNAADNNSASPVLLFMIGSLNKVTDGPSRDNLKVTGPEARMNQASGVRQYRAASRAKSMAVFRRIKERLDHLGRLEVAAKRI